MEPVEIHEGVSQGLSTSQARETTVQQRRAAAMRIGSVAAAGHHAADDLEEHFPQIARCLNDAAAGFEHVSSFLRDPNLDEVANFVGNLGRKQPAAVVAGVFLLAVGVAWFLRSPDNPSESFGASDRERGAYGVH